MISPIFPIRGLTLKFQFSTQGISFSGSDPVSSIRIGDLQTPGDKE